MPASKVPEHASKALMYPCLRKDGRCLCVKSARARIQSAHVSMFAQGWPLPMRRKCLSTHPKRSCIHVCARMAVAYASKVPEHASKMLMYPCLRKDGRCLCVESARARIQSAHVSMFAQGWPLPMVALWATIQFQRIRLACAQSQLECTRAAEQTCSGPLKCLH